MKRAYTLAVVLMFCAFVKASAQVEISPSSLDFGEIGTSLVSMSYWKRAIIRNTSSDVLTLRAIFPEPFNWNEGDSDVGIILLSNNVFGPGDSARLTLLMRVHGWGPTPFFEFVDTVWVGVRPVGSPIEAETLLPVPVYANVVETDRPYLSAEQGISGYFCRCYVPEDAPPSSSIDILDLFLVNPLSSTNKDTIWIDSIQVEELGGNGIPQGRFFPNVGTYDSIAPYDGIYDWYPPSHGQPLPIYVLPGMRASLRAGVPRFQPGNKESIVRAFVRRPRDGKTWVVEDRLQYYLGVKDKDPVGVGPGRDPIVMAPPLDVTKQDGISMNKCGLPDATPLWADTVYIRGPRQDAIDLVKRTGSDSLPKLPARLECFDSDVGYNIEVHRARTTPGTTVDTIVVEYHYEDPMNGRVEGITKRPFTIIIEPRTTGVVVREEEPFGTLTAIPNPATDRIRFAWRSFGRGEAVGVRLFDAKGRDVFARPIAFELSGSVEIDVSGLPAGAYRAVVEGREGNVLAVRPVMVVR